MYGGHAWLAVIMLLCLCRYVGGSGHDNYEFPYSKILEDQEDLHAQLHQWLALSDLSVCLVDLVMAAVQVWQSRGRMEDALQSVG